MTEQDMQEGKTNAIISYLTVFGTLIAYFMNNDKKNPFAAFHIRQALGLWITYFVLAWFVSYFDSWFATLGFWVFFGVLFIYGFMSALSGKAQKVPLLGDFYQNIFSSIR